MTMTGAVFCKMALCMMALWMVVLCFAVRGAKAQEIGSFFVLVNTYGYAGSPNLGKRFLVRHRNTYALIRSQRGPLGRLWRLIELANITRTVQGEGFVVQGEHLTPDGNGDVQVFPFLPINPKVSLNPRLISHLNIRLQNDLRTAKRFPQLTWQKVRYKSESLVRVWVLATKGIARFGVRPGAIQEIYRVMLSQQTPPAKRWRLMGGVVHQGDTAADVRISLGAPLRNQQTGQDNASRRVWDYSDYTVRFENGVVKEVKTRKNG